MLENKTSPSTWQPAAQQQVFRLLMDAFAFPGKTQLITPHALANRNEEGGAVVRVLATLLDKEVELADCDGLITEDDWHRLEACRGRPEHAQFILGLAERAPTFEPSRGTLENPEGGATVILRVRKLGAGRRLVVTGPGVRIETSFAVTGLNPAWLTSRETWNSCFPMGVDLLLVDDKHIVALPRTTRIVAEGENQWAM